MRGSQFTRENFLHGVARWYFFELGAELAATTTDENGLFRFMTLPPGLLYINVDAPGYATTEGPGLGPS